MPSCGDGSAGDARLVNAGSARGTRRGGRGARSWVAVGILVYYAVPVFIGLLLLERWRLRRLQAGGDTRLRGYSGPDARASLWMGVGNVLVSVTVGGVTFGLYFWLYQHRLFELGTGAAAFVLLFFAEDFTYYWWHRASHEVRFLWAAHENHHSSEYFNYSTALRQSLHHAVHRAALLLVAAARRASIPS